MPRRKRRYFAAGAETAVIKTHHNVGGCPRCRASRCLNRSALPQGRGARDRRRLGVRIVGAVTPDGLRELREADAIITEVI